MPAQWAIVPFKLSFLEFSSNPATCPAPCRPHQTLLAKTSLNKHFGIYDLWVQNAMAEFCWEFQKLLKWKDHCQIFSELKNTLVTFLTMYFTDNHRREARL